MVQHHWVVRQQRTLENDSHKSRKVHLNRRVEKMEEKNKKKKFGSDQSLESIERNVSECVWHRHGHKPFSVDS